MRGSNEKMTRSSSVVIRHDRRGSCVVMTTDGQASSPTAAKVNVEFFWHKLIHCDVRYLKILPISSVDHAHIAVK